MPCDTARVGTAVDPNGRLYRGQSPQHREAERTARFLDAGLDVFGTQGFHAATVDSLCATAGLTKRYFYQSFGSMEALFHAVYLRCTDSIMQIATASEHRPGDALVGLNRFFDVIEADPRVARIVLVEVFDISPATDEVARKAMDAFVDQTERSFATKPLTGVDSRLVAHGLVGAMHYIARQWLQSGYTQPRAEVAASCHVLFAAVRAHFDAS